tara:strand:+ start:2136 stop:2276 length:141 start_codon:yes stop_codon:yes gene_type:complete
MNRGNDLGLKAQCKQFISSVPKPVLRLIAIAGCLAFWVAAYFLFVA